ncbi:hypothetical protein DERP_004297 [Dermatophagoides pteronyssinus]|uniref:Secreted protein n=1 Tax=Dermatophagoides pteronyssinus TaxID=6956 RepID=A0ABQ8JND4_DERPT|nr:hypothetical protein DERP_004297 [Dermatophagoides pteronyssinus]
MIILECSLSSILLLTVECIGLFGQCTRTCDASIETDTDVVADDEDDADVDDDDDDDDERVLSFELLVKFLKQEDNGSADALRSNALLSNLIMVNKFIFS